MKVVKLADIIGTNRDVDGGNWRSQRIVVESDCMGYSLHDTQIKAGTETHLWYKYHLESVYVIEGEGEVETVKDGKVWPVKQYECYVLDKNDEHLLRAKTDMRMVCVFNPPVTGEEVHDEDGAYPLPEHMKPLNS
ncbi:ectoine synthase [Shouchella clausii]|uniref:ectoine synthase n=1 Tax=Shouchella TaxID=2893057 RepID=UPI0004E608B3|nr:MULTISPECIES: ectoine synthase [Shouchella]ALA52556.1 L-ectoine synthase [Shouchella clausii]MBU3230035.1 ectoine synthase [Shouchella clausii]MBU3262766.1 ectoine synthase [Shouchella clausii]MBU3506918.1 ectoine synthase [Shouchella clausii]MBU3535478.1 ectoine synthase [Shouchella clausii]